jgi:hypothetical protein
VIAAIREMLRRGLGLTGDAALMRADVRDLRRQLDETRSIVRRGLDSARMLTARLLIDRIRSRGVVERIRDAEFQVFSQGGDDGIIQYLLHHLQIGPPVFIEFGASNYEESNTRFLLANDNWKGLVLDGSAENVAHIKRSEAYWKHDLTAAAAFVTRENVNALFAENGFRGEIGLLSIDIDGNDYWVWESTETVDPMLVIVEYNSVFGSRRAVTIPYDPDFARTRAHASNLYYGASLKALCLLADRKGYAFVGSNSAGNNAYFVKRSRLGPLKALSVEEGYVQSRFRESVNANGELTFISGEERLRVIAEMPAHDVERGCVVRIGEL